MKGGEWFIVLLNHKSQSQTKTISSDIEPSTVKSEISYIRTLIRI